MAVKWIEGDVGQFRGMSPRIVPKRPDLKQAPRPIAPYAKAALRYRVVDESLLDVGLTPAPTCPPGSIWDSKTGQCVFHVPGPVEPEPVKFEGGMKFDVDFKAKRPQLKQAPRRPARPITGPATGCPPGYQRTQTGQCIHPRFVNLPYGISGYDWLVPGG